VDTVLAMSLAFSRRQMRYIPIDSHAKVLSIPPNPLLICFIQRGNRSHLVDFHYASFYGGVYAGRKSEVYFYIRPYLYIACFNRIQASSHTMPLIISILAEASWCLVSLVFLPPPYCWFLIASRCLMTVKFASRKRSTQFCVHVSSFLSSFPLRIVPVTHFLQQMSVREWTDCCILAFWLSFTMNC